MSTCSKSDVPELPMLKLDKSSDVCEIDLFIRRCKSREFSNLSQRLTYFEMVHAKMQRIADFKSEQEKEKIKFEFQSLAHDVFEWQNENLSFLRDNLLLTDQDNSDDASGKSNFYNDYMVPRMSDLSRWLQVEIPIVCKVIYSRPSSSAQVAYSLPGSTEDEECLGMRVQVSSCHCLEDIDSEHMSSRLRRTPCLPKTRSSLNSSYRSFGDLE